MVKIEFKSRNGHRNQTVRSSTQLLVKIEIHSTAAASAFLRAPLQAPHTGMADEQNFRANLSQFRWARGQTDASQPAAQPQASANPFSRFYSSVSGYVPLRSAEHTNEEEAYFALSRWERCVGAVVVEVRG